MTTFYLDYENGDDGNDGSSWANAWKTFTNGATAARIAPGDIIRVAKSPAPYSIGTATWTNLSITVELDAAQTLNIEMCESIWTINGSGDLTAINTSTANKEGTLAIMPIFDSSIQTSIMQAYKTITETDFSSYQKISFWFKNSAAIVANNFQIALCSDTAGATPVDVFEIPAIPSVQRWVPLTIARNGGGNLGSSIQSIALYTSTVAPTGGISVYLDDIIACTTSGLSLQSLISKNSAEQGGNEAWFCIQSINGTTIKIDSHTNQDANSGEGYYGTTENVTTYARETIKTDMASASNTQANAIQDSGTSGSNIEFQGGYDTGTSLQTGETFFDGLNGYGYGIYGSSRDCITLNHFNIIRCYDGIYMGNSYYIYLDNISGISCSVAGIYLSSLRYSSVGLINWANGNGSTSGIYLPSNVHLYIDTINYACGNDGFGIQINQCNFLQIGTINKSCNNASSGIAFTFCNTNYIDSIGELNNNSYAFNVQNAAENYINSITTINNNTGLISLSGGLLYINHVTTLGNTECYTIFVYDTKLYINDYGGYSYIYSEYANCVSQDATAGGTGLEWKISITNVLRTSDYPFKLKVAEIACAASSQVTVTCYFKKSHATDIAAKLITPGGEIAGVSETSSTCPSDTNRNQLQIQFTPTEAGVVTIYAYAWWVANTADENVIIDDIAVSQA